MTHTIIIKTTDDKDFELIKGLANRLGLPVAERHTEELSKTQEDSFMKLFGSWESDESANELATLIHSARNDSPRDIQL
jgi:hypothetical protein